MLAALIPGAGWAQDTDVAETAALIQQPMSVYKIEDMDFGLVAPGGAPGMVVLTASSSATCTPSGGLLHSGLCTAARFGGYSLPLSFVRVRRPPGNSLTLTSAGGATIQVTDFTYNGGMALVEVGSTATFVRFLVVDSDGLYEFSIGGTLNVAAVQAAGQYFGTIEVMLAYN